MKNDDILCKCGTETDAIEAAKKLYIQLASTDCKVWALGVATALRAMAVDSLAQEGIPKDLLKARCDSLVKSTRDQTDFEEIESMVKIAHQKLYAHS